jgi:aldehyde:ferredoxin oxidoreductase
MTEFGYAGEILKIDLSGGKITKLATAEYADRFLGGRGIAARIYWDMVPTRAQALDPDNCLIFITGPVAGFTRLAGCRWQICGKSPSTNPGAFSYANLGDRWGTWLKYAGYDGLVVYGKADKPTYILIDNDRIEIRDASSLWGKTSTIEACNSLKAEFGKEAAILSIGPSGENLVSFATTLADDNSSGSSGFGAVMGSKMLKAIVVAGDKKPRAADPERLRNLADRILTLRKDTWKDIQPTVPGLTRPRACYGCVSGCFRESYVAEDGQRFKFFCQATDVYRRPASKYYTVDNEVWLLANRLCDKYGLDTGVMQPMIEWLYRCRVADILNDENTGLPMSKLGSAEFIEELTRKISFREGFGDLLAQGTLRAAESLGGRAKELISFSVVSRASDTKDYDPRLILTNALLFATEPRRPITQLHEVSHPLLRWLEWFRGQEGSFLSSDDVRRIAEKFWGGAIAADFTIYEGKALAAKKIQDRSYAKESLILCDFLWPITWVRFSDDHVGDPTLESQVLSAITGEEIEEDELNRIGERVFNLQRAILLRQGWGGRKGDKLLDYLYEKPIGYVRFDRECIVLGKDGAIASRQGEVVDREKFEEMKSEYYELRGWNVENGLPTEKKLKELELADIAAGLKENGLLG